MWHHSQVNLVNFFPILKRMNQCADLKLKLGSRVCFLFMYNSMQGVDSIIRLTSEQGSLPCAPKEELNGSGGKVVHVCPANDDADSPTFHTRLQGAALDGETEKSGDFVQFVNINKTP